MSLIIVVDSHIGPGSAGEKAFFQMLEKLSASRYDIVFLGDIFELWIGLPRYEGPTHTKFLDWSREQKGSRTIGFIEGNHEFFVSAQHGNSFSWSAAGSSWQDDEGNLFAHGDQINRNDNRYLLFRRLTKNPITRTLLRYLPGGPQICNRLGQLLRHTNRQHRLGLPEEQIQFFADQNFATGVKTIYAGHFHSTYHYEHTSAHSLYLLPAWFESGQVTLVDSGNDQAPVQFINWEALPI